MTSTAPGTTFPATRTTDPGSHSVASGPHDHDWNEASVDELIDHIVDVHHAFLRRELPRIDELSAQVVDQHGERDPRLLDLRSVYKLLRVELEMHMLKEEQILFPYGRQLAAGAGGDHHCGSVRNPVAAMMAEHDDAQDNLAQMQRLTDGFEPPETASDAHRELLRSLVALEADLKVHIHEEDDVLFPRLVACEKSAS